MGRTREVFYERSQFIKRYCTMDKSQRSGVVRSFIAPRSAPATFRGRRLFFFPGIGALLEKPRQARRPRRGRPSRHVNRESLARSTYGTYLDWLGFFKLVRWWKQHAPPEVWEELFDRRFYPALAAGPGADKAEWYLAKRDADIVIRRLARKTGRRQSQLRQLVREAQWLDQVDRRLGLEAVVKYEMTRDAFSTVLLGICKRQLGRRRRLTNEEARRLVLDLEAVEGEWLRMVRDLFSAPPAQPRGRKWLDDIAEDVLRRRGRDPRSPGAVPKKISIGNAS